MRRFGVSPGSGRRDRSGHTRQPPVDTPAGKLEAELEYLKIAIDKTAGEAELQAWGWLMEAIAAHRDSRGPTR